MDRERIYKYLNDLRAEGTINMFAAPAVLRQVFGITKKESREVFLGWIDYVADEERQDRLKQSVITAARQLLDAGHDYTYIVRDIAARFDVAASTVIGHLEDLTGDKVEGEDAR